ncbi:hypothetical protein Forpe1208_v013604 [Fusarium oxysporum f. sp. rapae]|uniref:Uncharacterized protein n=1 Tax=Fusarium oxysporum f. sp. rapae TaxID=485398 RepID=A0A8J5NJZ8_FUSOX|nr:hypothetical protein Forpe1208_v013604 [Fusarium oxysporum f. sp. rapae]
MTLPPPNDGVVLACAVFCVSRGPLKPTRPQRGRRGCMRSESQNEIRLPTLNLGHGSHSLNPQRVEHPS